MKIGILGTGDVGQTLGRAFIDMGNEVRMGSREDSNEKAKAWAAKEGKKASTGTFQDAARFGQLIVLATLGVANESALKMAGVGNFEGKIVWDTTNPLDFSGGFPPKLAVGHTDSAGERVQRLLAEARVVKVFNSVGHAHMYKPKFTEGRPDMFIGGNDDEAKRETVRLLEMMGWGAIDLGGIETARYTEPMCMIWVIHGIRSNSWNHAFKMLRK